MPAIIMDSNSPCILITNVLQGQTVKLGNLSIVYRGMREENESNSNLYDDISEINDQINKQSNINTYSHLNDGNWIFTKVNQLENFDTNYSLDLASIEGIMSDNRGVVTAISIFNSTVMITNSQITLGFLITETTKCIPVIYT